MHCCTGESHTRSKPLEPKFVSKFGAWTLRVKSCRLSLPDIFGRHSECRYRVPSIIPLYVVQLFLISVISGFALCLPWLILEFFTNHLLFEALTNSLLTSCTSFGGRLMVCHVCKDTFVSVQERFFQRKIKASHIPQASTELRKALRNSWLARSHETSRLSNLV